MSCKECEFSVGHANWCLSILNSSLDQVNNIPELISFLEGSGKKYLAEDLSLWMAQPKITEFQAKFLIKVLKNYKNLRKSHFTSYSSGLKQVKITNELVMIDGLIVYLEELLSSETI